MHPVIFQGIARHPGVTDRAAEHSDEIGTSAKLPATVGVKIDVRGQLAEIRTDSVATSAFPAEGKECRVHI